MVTSFGILLVQQLFLVVLRTRGIVDWSWEVVFAPTIITVAILIIKSILLLIIYNKYGDEIMSGEK